MTDTIDIGGENVGSINTSGNNYEGLIPIIEYNISNNMKTVIAGTIHSGKTLILDEVERLLVKLNIPYIKYDMLYGTLPDEIPTDKVLLVNHPGWYMKELGKDFNLDKQEKAIFIAGQYHQEDELYRLYDTRIITGKQGEEYSCSIV